MNETCVSPFLVFNLIFKTRFYLSEMCTNYYIYAFYWLLIIIEEMDKDLKCLIYYSSYYIKKITEISR